MIARTETGRALRFALVGLLCAVTHNAVVIGLDRYGVHYALASVASYVIVVLLGFVLHVRFTFGVEPGLSSFVRYAIAMAANYPLTILLLFAMVDVARIPVAIATPSATVALFAWNYLASRWALARDHARPTATRHTR